MPSPSLISDRYEQAARFAAVGHRHQERRASGVPYVVHPFAVARIVEQAGFDETTVIAALLHDLVEDTATTLDEIRQHFGEAVAEIVAGCSEVKLDDLGQKRSWEDRKRDHLNAIRSASQATKAVVLADKLHNLVSIHLDIQEGRSVWDTFHAARDRVLWYFSAMIDCCETSDHRLRSLAEACRFALDQLTSS